MFTMDDPTGGNEKIDFGLNDMRLLLASSPGQLRGGLGAGERVVGEAGVRAVAEVVEVEARR